MKKTVTLFLLLFFCFPIYCFAQDGAPSDVLIVKVEVFPKNVLLYTGEQVHFRFVAKDAKGRQIPAAFNWSFGGGSLSRRGVYTAGKYPGKYKLEAKISTGVKGVAYITIKKRFDPVKTKRYLSITPPFVRLKKGQKCKFSFGCYTKSGRRIPIPMGISFSGGTMDNKGNYVAGNRAGKYQIKLKAKGCKPVIAKIIIGDSISSTSSNVPARIKVVPETFYIMPGKTQKLSFYIYNSKGESITTSLSLSVTGGTLKKNIYRAGNIPGKYKIVVKTPNGVKGVATAHIIGKEKKKVTYTNPKITYDTPKVTTQKRTKRRCTQIKITPSYISLHKGQRVKFSIKALDQFGKQMSIAMGIRFSGGKFTAGSIFIAGNVPGTYKLRISSKNGITGIATIHIKGKKSPIIRHQRPGSLHRIILTPKYIRVKTGKKCRFQFKAVDRNGNNVSASLSWLFRGGRLTSNGIYTAGIAPGHYYVILRSGKIRAKSIVAIVPEKPTRRLKRWWLDFEPVRIRLRPGQKHFFRYTITDDYGNKVHTPVKWKYLGGTFDPKTKMFTAGNERGDFYVEIIVTEYIKARAHIEIY